MHLQAIALLAPRAEESVDGDQHPERDERYARDSDRPAKAVGDLLGDLPEAFFHQKALILDRLFDPEQPLAPAKVKEGVQRTTRNAGFLSPTALY